MFLSQSCCHKLLVSASFWSWLLNVFFSFDIFEIDSEVFGMLMRCDKDEGL